MPGSKLSPWKSVFIARKIASSRLNSVERSSSASRPARYVLLRASGNLLRETRRLFFLPCIVYSVVDRCAIRQQGSVPTMNFQDATDRLMSCHSLRDVAKSAGVSYTLARQARLGSDKAGHRRPPTGWEKAIAKLARERAGKLVKLAEELEG